VRSGVLTSVHAFASDPARGLFILVFLALVIGGSLLLYAWRAPAIRSLGGFELVSREAGLLLNNILLVVTAATILLGTLYPLVIDALGLGKLSVGPPYFNTVFIPLTAPLAVLVGIGALARWKRDRLGRLLRALGPVFVLALVLGLAWPLSMSHYAPAAAIGAVLGLWAMLSAAQGLWARTRSTQRWRDLCATPGSVWGMSLAHFGLGIFIIGLAFTSNYTIEKDLRMSAGDSYQIGDYTYRFDGVSDRRGPNYLSQTGTITVLKGARTAAVLKPEKRVYLVQRMPMTEAGIDAGFTRDLYVALGEPLADGNSWAVRLYYKPYVRWIWLGPLVMVLGGIFAAGDRRYRTLRRAVSVDFPGSKVSQG